MGRFDVLPIFIAKFVLTKSVTWKKQIWEMRWSQQVGKS